MVRPQDVDPSIGKGALYEPVDKEIPEEEQPEEDEEDGR